MDRERSVSEAVVVAPSLSEDTFKRDNACVSCGQAFGKVLNIVHAKRYCCKFCKRGVCTKCSPYRLIHPSTMQQERCCKTCYSRLVTQDIRSETQDDLKRTESEVQGIHAEVFREIQAQEDCEAQIVEVLDRQAKIQTQIDEQNAASKQTIAQKQARVAELRSSLASLRSEIQAKQQRHKQALETLVSDEETRTQLRKQQTLDQQRITELQALQSGVDQDIEEIRSRLRDPVVAEEISEKNKRVVELQQCVALERDILVKLQHRNLELSQRRSRLQGAPEPKSHDVELREGALSNPHEPEVLKAQVAQLTAQNQELRRHLASQETPGGDEELEGLRSDVQHAKEENTRLMLQFQEQLLHPNSRPEALSRKHCSNCLLS